MYRGALPLTWQPREINHLPGITSFWQICSHRPGSRANGLQSISVKDTAPINYSVTCALMLWCYITIFTVRREAALPAGLPSLKWRAAFAWAIIPSAPVLLRGRRRDKLLSLPIKKRAGLWRCASVNTTEGRWRVCIVFKSLTRRVGCHHHAVVEGKSQCCQRPWACVVFLSVLMWKHAKYSWQS